MLTDKQMQDNKDKFIALIRSIKREGFDPERLIAKLCNSDFFTAPASTKFHCSFEGGLCQHSLNVYANLVWLASEKADTVDADFDEDSLKIVALLHDISKMNTYEKTFKNTKLYHENGSKYDGNGNFDWVSVAGWSTKENRFVYGSHEMTSEYIVRQFIPLTLEESTAILHHMGGRNWDSAQDDICKVFSCYPLAFMLHTADMLATYADEVN